MMKFLIVAVMSLQSVNTTDAPCIGIPITVDDFDKSIQKINDLYSSGKIHRTRDYVLSIRIANTLVMDGLIEKKHAYKMFYESFTGKYFHHTVVAVKAETSKGLSFYSKKYDLYIGGEPHKNSMFCIREP